jgi:acylphosphatase
MLFYAVPVLRYTIRFTGHVQGVGFRYTTVNVARRFAVAGWVRNEPDGAVLCVAEGEPQELDAFVDTVRQAMDGHITNVELHSSDPTGEFRGFEVRG